MTDHFVVPCAAAKRDRPAPARSLYVSGHFRLVLAAAEAEAAATTRDLGTPARVWILSARHGLVDPDTVLAPYDVTIGGPDAVDAFDVAAQILRAAVRPDDSFWTLLPRAYRDLMDDAVLLVSAAIRHRVPHHDVYEGAGPGIGYQRQTAVTLLRRAGGPLPVGPAAA